MDSSNIHYKSHKVVCSSTLNDGSYNYTAAGNPHVWTSNSFLNDDVSIASDEEALMNLRNPRLLQNENLVTSLNPTAMSSTTKDFGLESTCAAAGNFMNHDQDQNNNQLLLQLNSQIKQEVLYPNLYGRLFNFNENNNNGINNNNQSSSAASLEESSNSSSVITSSGSSRQQSCSQIYPTINVSEFLNNNQQPQPGGSMGILNYSSSGFGLNFQGLDLFNSAGRGGFGGMISSSFHQPLIQEDDLEFSKINNLPNFGMDFMKQSLENTLESGSGCNLSIDGKLEFLNKRVAELKKNEVINSEAKTGKTQVGKKRSRSVESRACPPLKVFQVRKEKLGDRIAALQQLVAPFGKTDTASVLMEAIGYIKFLQDQVETLSVPYLKSSRHKNNKAAQHGGYVDNKSEEQKQDLRSKGLCLVPLSCLSYVTDGGGAMWPPPHFG